jgi:nucleoid-associated protein YgaU
MRVSTNMGNLEKLGILVIVILVVVVGVVAITPKSTVDERLMPDGQTPSDTAKAPEPLEPVAPPAAGGDAKAPQDPWPSGAAVAGGQKQLPGVGSVEADPAAVPVTPAPAEAAPAFRTIKVQAGDTLAIIAKRELKSATRYPEILKANPGLVASKLHKGQEIRIPVDPVKSPAADNTAKTAPVAPVAGPVAVVPPVEPAPAPAEKSERIYVVKSGDTLSGIAGREMGSKSKLAELEKANEDVLHGSTALKIGMKLRIPASGSSEKSEKSAKSEKTSSTASDTAPVASGAETAGAGATEHDYVVKPGDSLWLIAKNECGSEKMIGALREANADVLKGSDTLKVGTTLKIPAKK